MQRPDQDAIFGKGDSTTAQIAAHEAARRPGNHVQLVDGAALATMYWGWLFANIRFGICNGANTGFEMFDAR